MSNFILVRYYFIYDLYVYILCIILRYKSLQFEKLINDITIDF